MALGKFLLGLAGLGSGAIIGAGVSATSPREAQTNEIENEPIMRNKTKSQNLAINDDAFVNSSVDNPAFNNSSQNFSVSQNATLPQSAFKSTNIAWLDEKLKNNTATAYDAYLAKNYLGMNLADYGHQSLDVNLNGKLAMTNLNKLYNDSNNVIANADLYDAVLASGKGNLGWLSEMSRDWHEIAPAFSFINKKNNMYRNLQNAMAWAAAIDATNGGKPNKYTQEHFMNMYQHTARDERAQTSLMASALKQNNIALMKNMQQIAQLRGGWEAVPEHYIQRYNKNVDMIKDLSDKKFNYDKFLTKYKLNADDSFKRYLSKATLDDNTDQNTQNPTMRD